MNRRSTLPIGNGKPGSLAAGRQRKGTKPQPPPITHLNSEIDTQRLHQELQLHQVELEVQNAELRESRDRIDALLEKYTDLYDFAPTGYFSLDVQGRILEVNLTGAAMLGVERSLLMNRRLVVFVVPASRPVLEAFLKRVFAGTDKQACEAALLRENGGVFWAGFHAISASGLSKWCRLAVSDITSLKEAEETQRRLDALAVANRELKREIVQRKALENSLKESEKRSARLLEQSRRMQEQLRLLSRKILSAQEEERKKISRELHDVIAQTLTGINVRLATLRRDAAINSKDLERNIGLTQDLVEESVNIVHRFARELRPAVLDDLGLIPALHAFMKHFTAETGIRVRLSAFAAVEEASGDKRTVLYRVAQEALTNVARHAQATTAEVNIQKLGGAICMKIQDNGKGFRRNRVLEAKRNNRLGLLGMRERLEMVGGDLSVISAAGKGTTVVAQVPLVDSTAKRAR